MWKYKETGNSGFFPWPKISFNRQTKKLYLILQIDRHMYENIDGHKDGHIEGHTDGHTDGHKDGHTDGHKDGHTDIWTDPNCIPTKIVDQGKNPKRLVSLYLHSSFSTISSPSGAHNKPFLTQPNLKKQLSVYVKIQLNRKLFDIFTLLWSFSCRPK